MLILIGYYRSTEKEERGSQEDSLKLTPESNLKEREDKSGDNGEEEYDKGKEARKLSLSVKNHTSLHNWSLTQQGGWMTDGLCDTHWKTWFEKGIHLYVTLPKYKFKSILLIRGIDF